MFWHIIRLFCAILSVTIYFTEPLILCCYIIQEFYFLSVKSGNPVYEEYQKLSKEKKLH